ncbi:MAG: hypothetical protein MJ245_02420 [Clostridia bacterium]|nr:hypothetical protein [Clostridia bacterium]
MLKVGDKIKLDHDVYSSKNGEKYFFAEGTEVYVTKKGSVMLPSGNELFLEHKYNVDGVNRKGVEEYINMRLLYDLPIKGATLDAVDELKKIYFKCFYE